MQITTHVGNIDSGEPSETAPVRVQPDCSTAALDWIELPPDGEGWFWHLDHGKLDIVHVTRQRAYGNQLCCLHGANFGPVEQITNALWAGPIPYPREP